MSVGDGSKPSRIGMLLDNLKDCNVKRLVVSLLFAALFACGSNGDIPPPGSAPPLKDVLTFELSFGDNNLPEEFLLVQPIVCKVDRIDLIYVPDEYSIKVYDSSGRPVIIIGGRGQGPGEFTEKSFRMQINSAGLIAANDQRRINLFDTDYKEGGISVRLINSINPGTYQPLVKSLQQFSVSRPVNLEVFPVIEDRFIVHYDINLPPDNADNRIQKVESVEMFMYTNGADYSTIKDYRINKQYRYQGSLIRIPFHVTPVFDVLHDTLLVHANPMQEPEKSGEYPVYTIHISNINNGKIREIKQPYIPQTISDSLKQANLDAPLFSYPEMREHHEQLLSEMQYFHPIRKILTDNDYIFVVTPSIYWDRPVIVDVFNGISAEYICSARFPFIPDEIANGYAYRINRPFDAFPRIEKYRIDPAVYGR